MENLQGTIKRIFIFIMLFITVLCENIYAQADKTREIDGKVSYKIESKNMTLQEAQAAIAAGTDIPLKVSVVFRGQWVDLFNQGFSAAINPSSFSYGIAEKTGTNKDDAPLYMTNQPAWILGSSQSGSCYTDKGTALDPPTSFRGMGVNVVRPLWETRTCPEYAYGLGFTGDECYKGGRLVYGEDAEGPYYEEPMFYIYFKLKRTETVYVRGIDGNYSTDPDNSISSTAMTTELNLVNPSFIPAVNIYWPGAPVPDGQTIPVVSDWTLAPEKYYGGIIPGGIFIEQSPEVAQLTPNFFA